MGKSGKLKISVIICTYNRVQLLQKAILSLAEQTMSKSDYEIIVIDNASTDNTKNIVYHISSQVPNLRYIYEPNQGLSYARNRGIQEAKGEVIAFIDDDAVASQDWLNQLMNAFDCVKPAPSCVGGKVIPIWEASQPSWLVDELLMDLAIVNWGDSAHFLHYPDKCIIGANMAFKKRELIKAGGFSNKLGRKKYCLLSNEENLLLSEMQKQGKRIYYKPEACVYHHIPKSRLSKKFFIKRAYWQGVSDYVLNYELGGKKNSIAFLIRGIFFMIVNSVRGLLARDGMERMRRLRAAAHSFGYIIGRLRF